MHRALLQEYGALLRIYQARLCHFVMSTSMMFKMVLMHRIATRCDARQRTAMHGNARQRTAAHGNARQRTTTHCNTMQEKAFCASLPPGIFSSHRHLHQHVAGTALIHGNALQYATAHCNALQRTATHGNARQQTAREDILCVFTTRYILESLSSKSARRWRCFPPPCICENEFIRYVGQTVNE